MSSIGNTSNIAQLIMDTNSVRVNSRNFEELSRQLSSGRKHQSLSAYQSAVSRIINLEQIISQRQSYVRAIELARFNVDAYQNTIGEIDSIASDVYRLSDSPPPDGASTLDMAVWRRNLLNSISLQMTRLQATLNTSVGSKYLFSGDRFTSPAVKDLLTLQGFSHTDIDNPAIYQFTDPNNLPKGSVHFSGTETTRTATIRVRSDQVAELTTKYLGVKLDKVEAVDPNAQPSAILDGTAYAEVEDDDPVVWIETVGPSVIGENGRATFRIKRKGGDTSQAMTVSVGQQFGTGFTATDLAGPVTTTYTIPAGQTEVEFTVDLQDDNVIANDELFGLRIDPNALAPGSYQTTDS